MHILTLEQEFIKLFHNVHSFIIVYGYTGDYVLVLLGLMY